MQFLKNNTACFTGYRAKKFPKPLIPYSDEYYMLQSEVCESIEIAVNEGYSAFLCGMCDGFDLLSGDAVIELRGSYKSCFDIRLIAVMPYPNYGNKSWGEWKQIKLDILNCADYIVYIDKQSCRDSYYRRNRFMIDNSSRVICYYSGLSGGTSYTVNYAQKCDLKIVNIYDDIYSNERQ